MMPDSDNIAKSRGDGPRKISPTIPGPMTKDTVQPAPFLTILFTFVRLIANIKDEWKYV